jgi:hypothetical protein
MFYRLEANLHDDVNLEGIADTLERAAEQVRGMSSVNAAHGMRLKGGDALKAARHGVVYLNADADLES